MEIETVDVHSSLLVRLSWSSLVWRRLLGVFVVGVGLCDWFPLRRMEAESGLSWHRLQS